MFFGVHYHPAHGHFLFGNGEGQFYTFLHLLPGEYQHNEHGIQFTFDGRLSSFSDQSLPHVVELPELKDDEHGAEMTCQGSTLACHPDFFLERLDWIQSNTNGLWSIGIHRYWRSPPFWFTFENATEATKFQARFGKERSAEIIHLRT